MTDALMEARREGRVTFVGLGEMVLSDCASDVLCAPNLGSCLGIAVYDPAVRVGALIHCVLPTSAGHEAKAQSQPYMFVDTGVVLMLNQVLARGAQKKNLVVAVAGGSNIADANNVFEIGKKNYTIFRKIMWKNAMLIKREHVGESISRTVSLEIESGRVLMKTCNGITQLV